MEVRFTPLDTKDIPEWSHIFDGVESLQWTRAHCVLNYRNKTTTWIYFDQAVPLSIFVVDDSALDKRSGAK